MPGLPAPTPHLPHHSPPPLPPQASLVSASVERVLLPSTSPVGAKKRHINLNYVNLQQLPQLIKRGHALPLFKPDVPPSPAFTSSVQAPEARTQDTQ